MFASEAARCTGGIGTRTVASLHSDALNVISPYKHLGVRSRRRSDRSRYFDKFDDPNLPGQLQVTVTLKQVSVGTELNIVQEGLPDVIPLEACYLGWQESLRNLAKLVEPEINQ